MNSLSNETARQNLLRWMEEQGLNGPALGREIGYTRIAVHRLTSGDRPITNEFRWQFANRYGYDLSVELLGTDREPLPEETPA